MSERKSIRVLFCIAGALFILCVPLFLLASNIRWVANDLSFHRYGFDKYGVYQETGLSREELDEISEGMIEYINIGTVNNTMRIFTEGEMQHLADVRYLIQLCYIIQWTTLSYMILVIAAGFILKRKKFLVLFNRLFAAGSGVSIILTLIIGIAALIDFDWLFVVFHRVFFRNDLWVSSGYLPRIYTGGFFSDAGAVIAVTTILEALFIGVITWFFILRRRRLMN